MDDKNLLLDQFALVLQSLLRKYGLFLASWVYALDSCGHVHTEHGQADDLTQKHQQVDVPVSNGTILLHIWQILFHMVMRPRIENEASNAKNKDPLVNVGQVAKSVHILSEWEQSKHGRYKVHNHCQQQKQEWAWIDKGVQDWRNDAEPFWNPVYHCFEKVDDTET